MSRRAPTLRTVLLPVLLLGCAASDADTAMELDCGGGTPSLTWYADLDGDGYGRASATRDRCDAPAGYVANATDCDDARSGVYPGAIERCDGLDGDCDGAADDADPDLARTAWYPDADGDGVGLDAGVEWACAAPDDTWVALAADCDDDDPDVFPGAADPCGGADADCDGRDDPCSRADEVSLGTADARLDGESAGDSAGSSVAIVGDVDGDSYADLLVAAPTAQEGKAYLVHGPVSGAFNLRGSAAHFTAEIAPFTSVTSAGDRDGDGLPDLALGAEGAAAVYLFPGTSVGAVALAGAASTLQGSLGDGTGSALALGGDLDGDGLDELLIGAENADIGGVVYVIGAVGELGSAVRLWGVEGERAGTAVASAGDPNGDGIADVIVGASTSSAGGIWSGAAYVSFGPVNADRALADADARLVGAGPSDYAGAAVAGVGDIDGDGVDDLVVGAPGTAAEGDFTGAAYLVLGPVGGDHALADARCTLNGTHAGQRAGAQIAAVGDVSADGRADVLIGSAEPGAAGAAWLLEGPFAGTISLAYAEVTFTGEAALDLAGLTVGGGTDGADVDGDGLGDLLIGSPGADAGGSGAGAASLVRGWGR